MRKDGIQRVTELWIATIASCHYCCSSALAERLYYAMAATACAQRRTVLGLVTNLHRVGKEPLRNWMRKPVARAVWRQTDEPRTLYILQNEKDFRMTMIVCRASARCAHYSMLYTNGDRRAGGLWISVTAGRQSADAVRNVANTGTRPTYHFEDVDYALQRCHPTQHIHLPRNVCQLVDRGARRVAGRRCHRQRPRADEGQPALPLAADELERPQLTAAAVGAQLHRPGAALAQRAHAHVAVVRGMTAGCADGQLGRVGYAPGVRCGLQRRAGSIPFALMLCRMDSRITAVLNAAVLWTGCADLVKSVRTAGPSTGRS